MSFKRSTMPAVASPSQAEQFGRRLSARLNTSAQNLDHDITERLRIAREGAVAHLAAQPSLVTASQQQGPVLSLGGPTGSWAKLSGVLPMVILLAGLFCIDALQDQYRADELADVDVELLTAELPPLAYTDPGFVQFLRSTTRD
jgi:hypothetical protein